jgi:hypothetical protein
MRPCTIYIDWNLFVILKNPSLEAHILLKEILDKNLGNYRLVYSPAHLRDLGETSTEHIEKRDSDLAYLSDKTNNKCIVNYWGSSDVIIDNRDANEFFETYQFDNSDKHLQAFENLRKLFTEKYGTIRDKTIRDHFNLEPSKICNFNVKQLDELIRMINMFQSLDDFLKFGLSLRTSPTDIISYIDQYITAYMSLDLISYYPDSMREVGNYENLFNDSMHSAYGSLCDVFITNDNKCFHKSRFLFEYFNCNSKLIRTCRIKDYDQLKNELSSVISNSK